MRRAPCLAPCLAMVLVAACTAPPKPPPPASLSLEVHAGTDQNPDEAGRPSPVAVRLVFLAGTSAFARADVFALSEHERATLGADDLGGQELIVRPGETRTVDATPPPGTQALGAVVMFRDIDAARWRAQAPVAASGPTRLFLATRGLTAVLSPP